MSSRHSEVLAWAAMSASMALQQWWSVTTKGQMFLIWAAIWGHASICRLYKVEPSPQSIVKKLVLRI